MKTVEEAIAQAQRALWDLIVEVRLHQYLYYCATPTLSDDEYDALVARLPEEL